MTPLSSDMRYPNSNANCMNLAGASATLYSLNEVDESDIGHPKNLHPLARPHSMELSPVISEAGSGRGHHDNGLVIESQRGRGR